METFLLVDDFNGSTTVLDQTLANSVESAQSYFTNQGWVVGEVISEADYLIELQLNQLENQSPE